LGQGPEEYLTLYRSDRILYDEETDDVFLCNNSLESMNHYIQVYSSTGEYKRKINLPRNTLPWSLVSFDNKSLFVFAEDFYSGPNARKYKETEIPYTTYYKISKLNGEILDSFKLKSNNVNLVILHSIRDTYVSDRMAFSRLVKGNDGLFLCNPETDTVFYYNEKKSLTPVLHKTPLVRNQDPRVVLTNVVDVERFMFFSTYTLISAHMNLRDKHYFLDKETGEIFQQKLILPDFKGKEFTIQVGRTSVNAGGDVADYMFELELYELKEAYKENRLSGKLKELVSTLDEDKDNNVYMLVKFK